MNVKGRSGKSSNSMSMVVPMYNVEPYLREFLSSLEAQTAGLDSFETVIVDDGSTDRSGEIAKAWASKHPSVRYFRKENGGLSSARNFGLARATGSWISFPDPDDVLSANYVAEVRLELERRHRQPLLMISTPLVFYMDASGLLEDRHPLRYRFKSRSELSSTDLGDFIQLSVNSVWLPRKIIKLHQLLFDGRIKPSFEDGHFVNLLLTLEPAKSVVFLDTPRYYYRKRADLTSLVDGAKLRVEWYIDQLRFGYLDLLERASEILGYVPYHVQRTVLYDVFWRFAHLINHPERAAFLGTAEKLIFFFLLDRIFEHISTDVINKFHLGRMVEEHKVGLLGMFKSRNRPVQAVYITNVDSRSKALCFSYYTPDVDGDVLVRVNGRAAEQKHCSRRVARVLDHRFFVEHRVWVDVSEDAVIDFATADGRATTIKRWGRVIGDRITPLEARRALAKALPDPDTIPRPIRRWRNMAAAAHNRKRYRDCWILMDRDDAADDNAEHLYRYLLRSGLAANCFFVLRPETPHWAALKQEGFKLIAFGSEEHAIAVLNARFVVSSHADHFILWPFGTDGFIDQVRYEFVFLQHGVIKDDLSRWLNSKPISLMLTSSQAEYDSVVSPDSNYLLSAREVKLTGLPRHDALIAGSREKDVILIMPTWRRYLAGSSLGSGMAREPLEGFAETLYARSWRTLLASDELKRAADEAGLTIVFRPHPNMAMYLETFDAPDHVCVLDPREPPSLQQSFQRARVLLTDYSSVAFEVAYLDQPTIYYQFDREEFFTGEHVYEKGYFDYGTDGFGPVVESEARVIAEVERILSGGEPSVYGERRRAAFRHRDGNCCERVYDAIVDLDRRPRAREVVHAVRMPGSVEADVLRPASFGGAPCPDCGGGPRVARGP